MFRQKPWLWVVVGCSFWVLLLGVWAGVSELNGTECYLAYTAERLDWGYMDHGLLSPVWVSAGEALAGRTTLGVRLFFILWQVGALGLFYTVVRRGVPHHREGLLAGCYMLVAFSQPLLQLYGLMALDETTLFCGAALLLWATDGLFRSRSWVWTLAFGGAWAWVGSTTLYGLFLMAAVLLCLVLMRPRRIGDWRVWAGLVLGSTLLLPAWAWQIERGWPVASHFFAKSETQGVFGALAAWFLVFNPLWIIPAAVRTVRGWRRAMEPIETTLRVLLCVTTGVMLVGGVVGTLSGVWVMPAILSLLYLLPRWAVGRKSAERYVLFVGGVGGLVVLFFLAVLIATPSLHHHLGMANHTERSAQWADTLAAQGVDRVVLEDDPLGASVLRRYAPELEAVALASVYGAPNQYTERIDFRSWVDRSVAVELRAGRVDTTLDMLRLELSAPRRAVCLVVAKSFSPVYDMVVELESVPDKVLTGSRIALLFWVSNPYEAQRVVGGQAAARLLLHFRSCATDEVLDVEVSIKAQTILPHQRAMVPVTIEIPSVSTGDYLLSMSVVRAPFSSRSNGKARMLRIVNPKSRF